MSFPRYEKYKESGVEWLGEVPSRWDVKPLKAVATCNDEVLPEATDPETIIEYVEISGVGEGKGIVATESLTFATAPSRARRIVRHGDVLISTVRTYLRAIATVAHPPTNLIASTGFAAIRPRAVHVGFLGYMLHAEYLMSEVIARSVGISYPAINASELMRLKGPLPSTEEQAAIATFLDHETAKIDALVEEQKRLIELLKEKRQAVISHAVTKGLNPNAPMKDSGVEWLGEVPAHWRVGAIKHFVIQRPGAIKTGPFGSQLTAVEMQAGEIKVYNQRSVIDKDFMSGDNFISAEKFVQLHSFETFPGDLLVTTRGTIGRCAILPRGAERGILHPCLLRLQVDCRLVIAAFLESLIQDSELVKNQLSFMSNATTIEVIYSDTIASVVIPTPPLIEQEAILSFIQREGSRLDLLVAAAITAVDLLRERRTALISAAVTGKIDVRRAAAESSV